MNESTQGHADLRVLLVEDDADHATLIRKYLRAATLETTTTWVASLADAKLELDQNEFDVVLLDLNLPDGSIDETMSSVVCWAGGAPVVVLTALNDIEVGIRSINEGAQDYVVKQEMTPSNLDRSLRYAIERARSQKCLHELTVQLQLANMALESFSSTVVHDLRSPVGRLKWYAELLMRDDNSQLSAKAQEYLTVIDRQAERMGGLITDLWTYAQRGGDQEPAANVECRALIQKVYEMLDRPEAFRLVVDDSVCPISTYGTALEVVLRNLIDNAIKHHDRPDGCVFVSCEAQAEHVEFVVRDDGPGIPLAVLENIRAPAVEIKSFDDSPMGLGLVVIRRIVERRGGSIHASNLTQGAEFRVHWPISLIASNVRSEEALEQQ